MAAKKEEKHKIMAKRFCLFTCLSSIWMFAHWAQKQKITLGIYYLLSLLNSRTKNNRIFPQNIIIDDSKVVFIFLFFLFHFISYSTMQNIICQWLFVFDKWYADFGFVSWRQKWKRKKSSNWKIKSGFHLGKPYAKQIRRRRGQKKIEQTTLL